MNAATPIKERDATEVRADAPHVLLAMSNVMEEVGRLGISKERRNQQQGYNFRGIDDVYNVLNSLMAKNRLLMLPARMVAERSEKPSKSGGSLNYTTLTVDFKMVSAVDGSSETIQTIGEAMDTVDKSSNKAQSAAMKYAALMVFMIPTEGDNDADATTHEVAPRPSMADMAINMLRGCGAADMFKDAWAKNYEGWKKAMSAEDYARVQTAKAELVAKFVKEAEETKAREAAAQSRSATTGPRPGDTPFDDEIPF